MKDTLEQPKKSVDEEPIRDWRGRFTKGSPGLNKGGRPKGSLSLVKLLREYLQDNPNEAHDIVTTLVKMGSRGKELGAVREIMDRIDGKVADKHEIEGTIPVQLVFMPAKELLDTED